MTKKKTLACCCVLAASALWGCVSIFVREMNKAGLSALEVLQVRSIVGAICIGVYLLLFHREKFRFRLKDIWCFLGVGVCNMLLVSYCQFTGLSVGSVAVMSVLLYTGPIFVMLFSVLLFHERLTKTKLLALFLAFAGCCFASGIGSEDTISVQIVLLGLGAGVGYSMYSVFGRFAINRGYDSWTITFYAFFFCALVNSFLVDWGALSGAVQADPGIWVTFLLFGFLMGFLAYLLYTMGLQGVESGYAAILASAELVVATIVGTVFYHEPLTAFVLIGIALVLGGIAVLSLGDRKKA